VSRRLAKRERQPVVLGPSAAPLVALFASIRARIERDRAAQPSPKK
jgi:hypothetical protein